RRNEQGAVRSDRNFAAVRQRNVRVEINRDLAGRDSQPEQDRFEGERRNHFAAITKEQRYVDAVRNFLRQIDEPRRRDQPQFFAWLAADAGKFDEIATLADHLSEPGNFGARRIGIGRRGEFSREQKPRNAPRLIGEDLFLNFFKSQRRKNSSDRSMRGSRRNRIPSSKTTSISQRVGRCIGKVKRGK